MTASDDTDPKPVVDAGYLDNLDALTRNLDDIEALAAASLADEPIDQEAARRIAAVPTGLSYDELTAQHQEQRELEAWGAVEIADLLDPVAVRQLDEWRAVQRLRWERTDLVVVGLAGFLGALANIFDTQVDSSVLEGLSWLKKSDLFRRWERESVGLPIDYTGSGFGGRDHRVRSAGHDIGRFFTALNQLRTMTFEGTYWEDGQQKRCRTDRTVSGTQFARVTEPHQAVAVLLKHWAADFVTPMSLPLPFWILIYEMPDEALMEFARAAYAGTKPGEGLNLRSGALTPGLGLIIAEIIIRTHSHLAAYVQTGSPQLSTAETAKRTELLLAAHAVAGAVSLSRTVAAAMAGGPAVAVRHLNVPVLMRAGRLALSVRSDAAARATAGAPTWDRLLADEAATWTLPEAITIAELLAGSGPGE